VMTFFGTVAQHLEVVSVKVVDRFEAADAITIVLDGHWRVKANGHEVRARSVNIFRFVDGAIAGFDVYPDSGRFAAALKES
jgi:ketosteroid isomerase-like protein